MKGVKAGTYDVVLAGNPLKSFLNETDGGRRVSLTVDGKRFPLTCTIAGCKAAAVPIRVNTKGSVVNLSN